MLGLELAGQQTAPLTAVSSQHPQQGKELCCLWLVHPLLLPGTVMDSPHHI